MDLQETNQNLNEQFGSEVFKEEKRLKRWQAWVMYFIAVVFLGVLVFVGRSYYANYKDQMIISAVTESLRYIDEYKKQFGMYPSGKNFYESFYYKNYPKENNLIVPRVMYSDGVYPYSQVKNNPGFAGQKKALKSVQEEMRVFEISYFLSKDRLYRIGEKCTGSNVIGSPIDYYCILGAKINISSWQTYRNDKYGLEIMYPNNWFIKDNNRGANWAIFLQDKKYENDKINPSGLAIADAENTDLSGAKNKRVFDINDTHSTNFLEKVISIYFTDNSKTFFATCTSDINICNQILSTFRFLGPETESN